MDFRVKKLILEEGMKNIAETEGVKLEMNFDEFHRKVDHHRIEKDEGEPKLDKGEAKGCSTCKYECKDCMDEPCHACILASSLKNASPKWEPKE